MDSMKEGLTPIRRQYLRIKQQYPDAIVFFRLGDFYETFESDAELVARELQIVLTSRSMGKGQRFPMAGIPYHAVEGYLAKLIQAGHKVAICEQLTDPRSGKGLVERDVVRVVTPGTVLEPGLLASTSNNYLVALIIEGERAGIAYADISTGEFAATQLDAGRVSAELERLGPSEVLVPRDGQSPPLPVRPTPLDPRWFELETAREALLDHFEVSTLDGYGCSDRPLAVRAAGAIIRYLAETQKGSLSRLPGLSTYSVDSFMVLDTQTRRNLEIFESTQLGRQGASLLSVIDLTKTPMGGRLLKKWLGQPLLEIGPLTRRLDAVEWLAAEATRRVELRTILAGIPDLERLVNRVKSGVAVPRELIALRRGLESVPQIKALAEAESSPLGWITPCLRPCHETVELIGRAIAEEPESQSIIKPGFSPDLDAIRSASRNAKQYLADLERKERERTGIKSLKVGYNKVFGYYIEVTTPNLDRIPSDYIRKQTLVGAERFFTPELKEYESLILNADERIAEMEAAILRQICRQVGDASESILLTAQAIAELDVLAAFAEAAVRYRYVRPQLTTDDTIRIVAGRHPVVEQTLPPGSFVPNDTYLSNGDAQIILLTGPNMAGKSTYMRQVALIVLMAQIGSFVPADAATIGLVDRIFTRVGLVDDLAAGRSTFMIEMTETANILNNATSRSLIVLDEIGRGTSTYDGLSIAHAVIEHIHNHPRLGAKTLFATHYHELVALADVLPRVKNFNVAVADEGEKVIFLRKIVPGGADRSYGIHVARLAGLPRSVIRRAEEVLKGLEDGSRPMARSVSKKAPRRPTVPAQIPLFGVKPPVIEELESLDIDSLTPLEAITKLYELQKKARNHEQTRKEYGAS